MRKTSTSRNMHADPGITFTTVSYDYPPSLSYVWSALADIRDYNLYCGTVHRALTKGSFWDVFMGILLQQLYDEAEKIGGIKAQMRLAMLTGLPRRRALTDDDSPESIKLLQNALVRIKKEM